MTTALIEFALGAGIHEQEGPSDRSRRFRSLGLSGGLDLERKPTQDEPGPGWIHLVPRLSGVSWRARSMFAGPITLGEAVKNACPVLIVVDAARWVRHRTDGTVDNRQTHMAIR